MYTFRLTSELEPVVNSCLIDTTVTADTDFPTNARCSPRAGGVARITWQYQATAQPTGFRVRKRSDAGDAWVQDLGLETFNPRRTKYFHTSSEITDKVWFFKVTNLNDQDSDLDSDFASCVIDGTGPAAISDLSASLPEWNDE